MPNRRPEPRRRRHATPAFALAFALALLLAQTLALLHGVAHGGRHGVPRTAAPSPAHGEAPRDVGVDALFASHGDDPAQCRLVDQLAHHALAVCDLHLPLLAFVGEPALAAPAAARQAVDAPVYRARAPPPAVG